MEINKILKWLVYIGIFSVFLVPFSVPHGMFFPYITGKGFIFRVVVELMFGMWLILSLRDKSYHIKWSWLSTAITVFTLVVAVADVFGENSYKSFWSNFERMDGLITIIHLWAYFIVLSAMLKTEGIWTRLFNFSIVTSVFMSINAVLEASQNAAGYRVDATLGNPVYLAVYILINIFLAIFLLYRQVQKNGGLKNIFKIGATYVYAPIILLQLYVLYHTETRGSILGLMGGLFLTSLIITLFEKRDLLLKKVALGVIIAVVAVVGLFLSFKDAPFVKSNSVLSRFASISFNGQVVQARFMVWPMAWQGVKERPLLGWGQEGFNYVFNKYYDPGMYSQEQWFDRTHNVFLDWLIAAGVLGLLSYLSIFGVTLWLLWRLPSGRMLVSLRNFKQTIMVWSHNKDWDKNDDKEETSARVFSLSERAILIGMLAAYFFHNLFVFDNLISYILFFSILAYIQAQEHTQPVAWIHNFFKKFTLDDNTRDSLFVPLICAVTIAVALTLGWFNYYPYLANESLISALTLSGQGQIDASLKEFKKTLAYGTFANTETREQLLSFATGMLNNQSVSNQTKQEVFDLAFTELQKQISLTPKDTRYLLFTGTLLDAYHNWDQALPYLLEAEKTSPNKQTIKLEIVSNYLNQGKTSEALAKAKEAFDLAPSFKEARIIYAITLLYSKQTALAEKVLAEGKDPEIFKDSRLQSAYLNNGGLDASVKALKAQIAANPKDLSPRYQLVNVYVSANKRAEAIIEVQNMVKIDPTLKEQADGYIKQLQGK